MRSNHEKGQAFPELGIIIILIVILVWAIFLGVRVFNTLSFDSNYDSEKISFDSNLIVLGEEGNPKLIVNPAFQVPDAGTTGIRPRVISIKNCEAISMYADSNGVRAATTFPNPELISVSVPRLTSGRINVCVPNGTTIDVILWEVK